MLVELALLALGLIFSVVGYLLSHRDKKQGEDISRNEQLNEKLRLEHQAEIHELFRLLNSLKSEFKDYQIDMAKTHYPKHELDERFRQLTTAIEKGFEGLGITLKEMTRTVNDHIANHHKEH